MKYRYAYKTSDGRRHEASMDAESREAVFEALRAKGIRPIKVIAADGSKANGEVRREYGIVELWEYGNVKIWKWGIAAILILITLFVAFVLFVFKNNNPPPSPEVASPRHQIYGDPAIVGGFEHGDFGDALPRQGDRLLAWFSQPGRITCPRNTSRAELLRLGDANVAALKSVVDSDVEIADADSREVRELKQIVNGIRQEMREYLANGNGTPRSFWRRLNERTQQEAQIYERTRREIEMSPETLDERNASLRKLGLPTISIPEVDEKDGNVFPAS